ncbi:hypothetical protein ABZ924_28245 [Streptomyces sp. NPDC046876]|uniref:hypothetical protein n=1 Tax=Streptomyces sp. NPDC046876 TaxID=3155616 RepID=UPI00340A469B
MAVACLLAGSGGAAQAETRPTMASISEVPALKQGLADRVEQLGLSRWPVANTHAWD